MKLKIKLESLDGQVITPRTGKTSVIAEITRLPIEGWKTTALYLNEDCESPGVSVETNNVERLGNEIKFYDCRNRPFMITLLD